MIEAPTMNRVIDCLPEIDLGKIWSLFKVTEPRFTYVMCITTTEDDPREPRDLGTIYRDEVTGKTITADTMIFVKKGKDHKDLYSIQEVAHPEKLQSWMTRKDFMLVGLSPADLDTQEELTSFIKAAADKAGFIFEDRRKRTQQRGISPNGIPACTLS